MRFNTKIPFAILCGTAAVLTLLRVGGSQPAVQPGVLLVSTAAEYQDTLLIENRQMGYVDLEKFDALAQRLEPFRYDSESCLTRNGDSVTIVLKVSDPSVFFNSYNIDSLKSGYYRNMPISVVDAGKGFTAKVATINEREYIYIPYFVLANLADRVSGKGLRGGDAPSPTPRASERTQPQPQPQPQPINYNNVRVVENDGLVQIEKRVLRNFTDIQAIMNTTRNPDPIYQLSLAWQYVKDRWQYIYDPNTDDGSDTWRSAEETIENYYSNNKYYSGDCDDFAILMASFAKQVGLQWRCLGKFNAKGEGHMYAEYLDPKDNKWYNMDWASNEFGGTPFQGEVRLILKDPD